MALSEHGMILISYEQAKTSGYIVWGAWYAFTTIHESYAKTNGIMQWQAFSMALATTTV